MRGLKIIGNLFMLTLVLAYISKYAMQQIQVDFFTTYPNLNPANGVSFFKI
jgi:hypothetical protein